MEATTCRPVHAMSGPSSFGVRVIDLPTGSPHAAVGGVGKERCDAPIPGVPLTTRQSVETCGYRVLRYHTHMAHTSRPISINFLTNNLFLIIFYKSLMYDSSTLLHAKIY